MAGFIKKLQVHSIGARQRWRGHMEDKRASKPLWNQVLVEEVGKLSRCCNKLAIAQDPTIIEQWNREAKHRLITIASVCQRFYGCFEDASNGR